MYEVDGHHKVYSAFFWLPYLGLLARRTKGNRPLGGGAKIGAGGPAGSAKPNKPSGVLKALQRLLTLSIFPPATFRLPVGFLYQLPSIWWFALVVWFRRGFPFTPCKNQ